MKGWKMFEKIKELKRLGFKKRRAAREIGISRETVDKYWDMSDEEYLKLLSESKHRGSKLDLYRSYIIEELRTWSEITSSQIHDHLKEKLVAEQKEWIPSQRLVQEYVTALREELGLPTMSKIRQYEAVEELPYGKQGQVDMGVQAMKDTFGKSVKVYIFAMVLSRSRHKFVYFQLHPFNSEEFVTAHDLAFKYYCGRRPEEIAYDQDRVMAVSENAGDLLLTDRFESYRQYAGFSLYLCHARDPQSKGKIENVVKYVKHNFLSCRTFAGIQELNSAGLSWLDRTGNGKKHETTKMVPSRMFMEEVRHMARVPELSEGPKPTEAIIRVDNVVHYKQNRYRVPRGTYAPGRKARILPDLGKGTVSFYDAKTGELLAEHEIALGTGKLVGTPSKKNPGGKTGEELKSKVLLDFASIPDAPSYVELVLEKYHRYVLPQLRIFRKTQEQYTKNELSGALDYCIEHDLYSANDFRDTLLYLAQPKPAAPVKRGELSSKYSSVRAQTRSVSVYGQLTGGATIGQ
jgi:transposase